MPFSSINAILNKTCVDCHHTPSIPDILIKINGCSHKHHLHCLIDRSQKVLASTQSMSCHNQCQNTINLEKIIQASEKNAKTAMPQTLSTMIQQLAETFTTKTDQETAAQAYHHLASLCGPEQTLFINNKYLNRIDLLTKAIDFALMAKKPDLALDYCKVLLRHQDSFNHEVFIQGHLIAKEDLKSWVSEQHIPRELYLQPTVKGFKQSKLSIVTEMDAILLKSNNENAMLPSVQNMYADILNKLRHMVPKGLNLPQAHAEIKDVINNAPYHLRSKAFKGLEFLMEPAIHIPRVGTTPQGAMVTVWSYIRTIEEGQMKENLKKAFVERFAECHLEQPCPHGTATRMLDTLNGIDPAFTGLFNPDAVKDELSTIIAKTNELTERVYGGYVDSLKLESPEKSEEIQSNFNDLKRDIMQDKVFMLMSNRVPRSTLEAEFNDILPQGTAF